MRKILWCSLLFFCGTLLNACQPGNRLPVVVITTSAGEITATIDTVRAPISGANFMKLVDAGAYDTGATFYRVVRPDNQPDNDVKIDVIQGGLRNDSSVGNLTPIAHETTEATGLKHLDGTLSMARSEPGSASSEFFICIGDQPELDFNGKRNPDGQGFAAFGRVTEGMDVVRRIQQLQDSMQILTEPVKIVSIRRVQ